MVSTLANQLDKTPDPLFGKNHFTPIRWVLAGFVALGHFWLTTFVTHFPRAHSNYAGLWFNFRTYIFKAWGYW